MNYEINQVDITLLQLDLENPRLESVENQREAITEMIDIQGDKLTRLGKDIIENGLNPCDPMAVMPSGDFFTVLEGNRRITAIKLLKQPTLAQEAQETRIQNAFEKLAKDFQIKGFDKVPCVVFESREAAHHWIELKHTGENNGIGTVAWGSAEKDRYQYAMSGGKKRSYYIQLQEYCQEHCSHLLNDMLRSPKTNINRIISSKFGREFLGFTLERGILSCTIEPKETEKGLKKLFADLASKTIKVKDIYDNEDITNYLQSFPSENTPQKIPLSSSSGGSPSKTPQGGTNTSPNSGNGSNGNNEDGTTGKDNESSEDGGSNTRGKGSKRPSENRLYLIPSSCKLAISNPRINSMYWELKQKIKVEDAPNCISIAFRVFVELSFDQYMKNNSINGHPMENLSTKVQKCLKHMKINNIVSESEAKVVNVAISEKHGLFSLSTLHAYVHNPDFRAIPFELKVIWDNWQPVLKAIWS